MNAIPTKYAGVQFRSRLEARWAAFFDLCEFPWQYEPFDCDGYIPDFLLFGKLLVEVKPIVWNNRDEALIDEAKHKLEDAGDLAKSVAVALVGAGIHEYVRGSALCGLFGRHEHSFVDGDWRLDDRRTWSDLQLDWWKPEHELSFQAQPIFGSRRERLEGIKDLWHEAGNRVQWRGASSVATHGGPPPPLTDKVPPAELLAFFRRLAEEP